MDLQTYLQARGGIAGQNSFTGIDILAGDESSLAVNLFLKGASFSFATCRGGGHWILECRLPDLYIRTRHGDERGKVTIARDFQCFKQWHNSGCRAVEQLIIDRGIGVVPGSPMNEFLVIGNRGRDLALSVTDRGALSLVVFDRHAAVENKGYLVSPGDERPFLRRTSQLLLARLRRKETSDD